MDNPQPFLTPGFSLPPFSGPRQSSLPLSRSKKTSVSSKTAGISLALPTVTFSLSVSDHSQITSTKSAGHIPNQTPPEARDPLTPPSHLLVLGAATIILGEEHLLILGCCASPQKRFSHQIGDGYPTKLGNGELFFLWQ